MNVPPRKPASWFSVQELKLLTYGILTLGCGMAILFVLGYLLQRMPEPRKPADQQTSKSSLEDLGVHVVHDDIRGVTCYWIGADKAHSISCVPD